MWVRGAGACVSGLLVHALTTKHGPLLTGLNCALGGLHCCRYGLWMQLISGVSLENFLHKGAPTRVDPAVVLDTLHNRLNKTQVGWVLGSA